MQWRWDTYLLFTFIFFKLLKNPFFNGPGTRVPAGNEKLDPGNATGSRENHYSY